MLKLRAQAAQELEHFAMETVPGYARCDVYPSLMPLGYACQQAPNEPTANKDCPVGTLYSEKHMKVLSLAHAILKIRKFRCMRMLPTVSRTSPLHHVL